MSEGQAVVTGGGRGLGLEWVRQLLAIGWSVVAAVRQPGRSAPLAELASRSGDRLAIERFDAAGNSNEMAEFAARVAARWDHLDLLVNNAGINQVGPDRTASAGPLPHIDPATLAAVLRTNTVGPVALTAALAPLLAAAGGGRVVNTSSRLGSLQIASGDDPYARDYGYRMSKAGLNMATVHLARDLAAQHTIVVAMSPGWVRTDMTAHQQAELSVEESVSGQIATTIALVPADSGRYLAHTGETLPW